MNRRDILKQLSAAPFFRMFINKWKTWFGSTIDPARIVDEAADAKYQIGEVVEFIEEETRRVILSPRTPNTIVIQNDVSSTALAEIMNSDKADDQWMYELRIPEHHVRFGGSPRYDLPELRVWVPESFIRKLPPPTDYPEPWPTGS